MWGTPGAPNTALVGGAISSDPPRAERGGALWKVQDGLADSSGVRHNFRILTAESDRQFARVSARAR